MFQQRQLQDYRRAFAGRRVDVTTSPKLLEALVERKGLMSGAERLTRIGEWDEAARATPHGQPIVLNRSC